MPEAATTETEIEATDVAATVAAAFDKLEAADIDTPDVSHETAPEPPPEPEPSPEPAAADAAGEPSDAVREGQEAPRETTPEVATEQAAAETVAAYPEHWDQKYKGDFDQMPPNMQNFLVERHKSMEADYTRKNMETADLRREYEPVDQMMRAFTPLMQQQGIGPGTLIRKWAQAESYLNSQPEQAIKQLANYYGVDLAAIAYDSPAQQDTDPANQAPARPDPQVQSLTNQVHNLTTQQHLQTINTFADEVGANGQKIRPFFDDVAQDIVQDMRAAKALGLQPSLQELYEQACWKNTSVRERMLSQQGQQQGQANTQVAQAKADEARQKAAQAMKASRSISGDAGSSAEPRPEYKTVEEATAAAYDKLSH